MLIAIHNFRKEIYIKKNVIGRFVVLQDIKDKSHTIKYPIISYIGNFNEWELIKGGKE